jgi:CRP/FNR family transcriptional regulator
MYDHGSTSFPVLSGMAESHRRRIAESGSCVEIDRGTILFDVGDACSGLGLVLEGCVRVSSVSETGRELVLYRVRPGETCTITASCLMSSEPYPAMGVIEEAVTALIVPENVFHELLRDSDVFRRFAFGIFTARIDHLMELVANVAFHKLDSRIASRLIELGPVIEKTHQELADEVGSSREMVSRILESFSDQGFLILGRKRIEIADPVGIERIGRH